MAKRLTMADFNTILTLHKAGHSNREISALLGVNRETVGKYLARAKAQNQPNAPTGNVPDDPNGWDAGGNADNSPAGVAPATQPNAPTGSTSSPSSGPASACKPFRDEILAKIGQGLTQARGVEGVRVLVGLRNLAGKHDSAALEEACRVALSHGAYRLRTVRELLKRKCQEQHQFEFLQEHPIIRPLSDYSLASLLQFRKERHHDECQTG